VGEYGVTFLVVLVGAGFAQVYFFRGKPRRFWVLPLLPAVLVLAATFVYGHVRCADIAVQTKLSSGPRIALIQGNSLAVWKTNYGRVSAAFVASR